MHHDPGGYIMIQRICLLLTVPFALVACDTFPSAPVEEFVILDPGEPIEVIDVVPVEASPGFASDLADVTSPAPRRFGCPAGAGVLYGGTQYCTTRSF